MVPGNWDTTSVLGTYLSGGESVLEFDSPVSGKQRIHFISATEDSAIVMLKRGIITSYLVPGPDGKPIVRFDPASTDAQLSWYILTEAISGNSTQLATVRELTLIGTRYIDFLVPGLIAFGIMNSALWGIGFGLIEYRMKKLLRRMLATPMKKHEFMISLMAARIVLSVVEVVILMVFAWLYFDLLPTGSLLALGLLFLVGNLSFTGIAILLSCRADNTRIGVGFINAVSMPMMILSGIFFSYHNFPEAVIPFIQYLPLTLLADSIRAVFNEGAGLIDSIPALIILSATGLITAAIGLRLYKWH